MLFQHFNIGHSQISWDIRTNEKIVNVFSSIYNVDKNDLIVSFDGLSFQIPPEITKRGSRERTRTKTFHTDQSYLENDFKCIQSWITSIDVNEGDATLVFLEGSNNFHKDFRHKFIKDDKSSWKDNWHKLNEDELNFYIEKGCKQRFVTCKKGSLVLWDSRTIHYGIESSIKRDKQNFRAVIYLCYLPRSMSTEKDLEKKRKAFKELRTTSHWPNKIKLFSKLPRSYGKVLPEIKTIKHPFLNDLGLRLAGF
jgi:hypothetical protein